MPLFSERYAGKTGAIISAVDVIKGLVSTGMTSVIVTHEMGFAREVGNRVLFMDEGKVVEQGTPEEIFGNPQKQETRDFLARFRNN